MAKKLHWGNKVSNKIAVKELITSVQTAQTSYSILKMLLILVCFLFLHSIQVSQKNIQRVFENFPIFLFTVLSSH